MTSSTSGQTYLNTEQTVRRPRYVLLANGNAILDSTKISVTNQNNFHADRCSVTILTNGNSQYDEQWWGTQDEIDIEVKVGFLAPNDPEDGDHSQWTSIFAGRVDHVDWHAARRVIEAEARDYSAVLMDAKTRETFSNQTASEMVKTLAARHGLKADVQDTSTIIGVYLKSEHEKVTLDSLHSTTTEWALIVWAAQQEGFDVWMTGRTLHFKPAKSASSTPYRVHQEVDENGIITSNVTDLRCSRDLTKTKDLKVVVKSWNAKQKTAHTYTAGGGSSGGSSHGKGKGSVGSSAQEYVFVIPNLSPADAQKEANRRLALLTKLERVISYREPGNLDYTVRDNVVLDSTGTSWDQRYWIEELSRHLSFDEGFVQNIRARNHDTRSQTTV